MSCTTTLHVAVKTEHVCRARQSLHAPHFTTLCFRYPHSAASCRARSGFFTTVLSGLKTYFCVNPNRFFWWVSLLYIYIISNCSENFANNNGAVVGMTRSSNTQPYKLDSGLIAYVEDDDWIEWVVRAEILTFGIKINIEY